MSKKIHNQKEQAETVLDMLLEWDNPGKMFQKHGYNRIHAMRYTVRRLVKLFEETGNWQLLDPALNITYNNIHVLNVLKDNWDYIKKNIDFSKRLPRTKAPVDTCADQTTVVPLLPEKETIAETAPKISELHSVSEKYHNLLFALNDLDKAYTSYNLTAEQIIHKIKQLI